MNDVCQFQTKTENTPNRTPFGGRGYYASTSSVDLAATLVWIEASVSLRPLFASLCKSTIRSRKHSTGTEYFRSVFANFTVNEMIISLPSDEYCSARKAVTPIGILSVLITLRSLITKIPGGFPLNLTPGPWINYSKLRHRCKYRGPSSALPFGPQIADQWLRSPQY
jgi:hypothetical protein